MNKKETIVMLIVSIVLQSVFSISQLLEQPAYVTQNMFACLTKNSDGGCSVCAVGYNFRKQDIYDKNTCEDSPLDVYGEYEEEEGQYVICAPGCILCQQPDLCQKCKYGFVLIEEQCKKCSGTCRQCSEFNQDQCLSCFPRHYLTSFSQCERCQSELCLNCNSQGCQQCSSGYYASQNLCIACPTGCLTCDMQANHIYCSSCQAGYVLRLGEVCTQCAIGKTLCDSGNITKIVGCKQGFYMKEENGESNCYPCTFPCAICSSNETCDSCLEGFHLIDRKCLHACYFPCRTCIAGSPSSCSSCYEGYNLSGDNCIIQACEGVQECQRCDRGQYLSQSDNQTLECESCEQNCAYCSGQLNMTISSEKICLECLRGYYWNQTKKSCEACPPSCELCSSFTFCQKCSYAHYLVRNADLQPQGLCLSCDQHSENINCLECHGFKGQVCTNCKPGFILIKNKCLTSPSLKISIYLDATNTELMDRVYVIKDEINKIRDIEDNQDLQKYRVDLTIIWIDDTFLEFYLNLHDMSEEELEKMEKKIIFAIRRGNKIANFDIFQKAVLKKVYFDSEGNEVLEEDEDVHESGLLVLQDYGYLVVIGVILFVIVLGLFVKICCKKKENEQPYEVGIGTQKSMQQKDVDADFW